MTSIPTNARDAITPYFTEFLAGKLHQPLLPKLQRLSAVFQIELRDAALSSWTLSIKSGMLDSIVRGAMPAQCVFKVKPDIFTAIISGKQSPQMAFFKRDVEIGGDIVLGLKLATVLAEFFERYPWSA